MKYFLLILIAFSSFGLFKPAEAHVLKSDGNVSAWLHIDPDDDAVIGQNSALHLFFLTPQGFDTHNYSFEITVQDVLGSTSLEVIPGKDLLYTDKGTLSFNYVFSKKGLYTVSVHAAPIGTSTAFNLIYDDIRVDRTTPPLFAFDFSHLTHSHHFIHYLFFVPLIIVVFGMIIYDKLRQRKIRKKMREENALKENK